MCAAIAAARQGLRVALIQDRKVLGGNNSSEVRVGLGGRLNIGAYPSLGYLLNEFGPSTKGNARTPEVYEDEKRITLLLGYKVTKVNKRTPRTIESVVATDVDTYRQIVVRGPLFADCTGDATLGVLAGAEWSMGREARSKYGEPSAPDTADGMTMGASVQWYCLEADAPTAFPDIEWGLPIDERSVQIVRRGQWYWEVGMRDDQIADAEKIRDYGMYVAYSNWSYLKNRSSVRDRYANSYLGWVAHVAGKRESRRLLGEFVLREQDLMNFTIYPDGTASTSWYIDQLSRSRKQQALPRPRIFVMRSPDAAVVLSDSLPLLLFEGHRQPLHGRAQHLGFARRAGHGARDAHHGDDGRGGRHGRVDLFEARSAAARRLRYALRGVARADAAGRGAHRRALPASLHVD